MLSEWERQRPLDVLLSDMTCNSEASVELRELLGSVEGLSVVAETLRPGHKLVLSQPHSLLLLVVSRLTESEQQQLLATLDPRERPVILAALHPDADTIGRWLDAGAVDYFLPPWNLADILPRIRKALHSHAPRREEVSPAKKKLALDQMIGQSPAFYQAINRIPAIAACDAGVLITGETGTGKELCARAIHYLGPRSRQPFVPLNCGAIPSELVENELFGHSAGAYTSAATRHTGIIAEAEGGTLFLDEVDSLPTGAQIKLLRFLQSKEYRPLGSTKTLTANVRMVAATNADPSAAVKSGKMRQDLYYRLSVIPVRLPPLRERRDDIPLLASHFQSRYAREYGKSMSPLPEEVVTRLIAHDWPGNIRELENAISRMVALSDTGQLLANDLDLPSESAGGDLASLRAAKGQFERAYIEEKLRSCGGNISHAAQAAGKDRRAFWELIRKHRIQVEQFRLPSPAAQ
jgi:two-component system response regulator GlrR